MSACFSGTSTFTVNISMNMILPFLPECLHRKNTSGDFLKGKFFMVKVVYLYECVCVVSTTWHAIFDASLPIPTQFCVTSFSRIGFGGLWSFVQDIFNRVSLPILLLLLLLSQRRRTHFLLSSLYYAFSFIKGILSLRDMLWQVFPNIITISEVVTVTTASEVDAYLLTN